MRLPMRKKSGLSPKRIRKPKLNNVTRAVLHAKRLFVRGRIKRGLTQRLFLRGNFGFVLVLPEMIPFISRIEAHLRQGDHPIVFQKPVKLSTIDLEELYGPQARKYGEFDPRLQTLRNWGGRVIVFRKTGDCFTDSFKGEIRETVCRPALKNPHYADPRLQKLVLTFDAEKRPSKLPGIHIPNSEAEVFRNVNLFFSWMELRRLSQTN
jgi:hypothetical protein